MNCVATVLARSIATGKRIVRGAMTRARKAGRLPIVVVALLVLVVSLVAVPLLVSGWAQPVAGASVLLSQGRPATASSQASATFAAGQAVDGVSGTRWASVAGVEPQWIQVDLGAVYRITQVVLLWEASHAVTYQVQASADASRWTWTSLYATSNGGGGTENLHGLTGSGRYVRVLCTRGATPSGYTLREFRVYGAADPVPWAMPSATTEQPSLQPSRQPLTHQSTPAPLPSTGKVTAAVWVPPTARSSSVSRPTTSASLREPARKDTAMKLVSSAENSSLDWKAQYAFVKDIGDGRGYTAGIIGFCSGTGDMLRVVTRYTAAVPGNVLARYLPALRQVNGSASHAGLDPGFPAAWRTAAGDPRFRSAQDVERDDVYFSPAVGQAERDGLHALGQFIYYDAMVMHGPGSDGLSFGGIRQAAMRSAKTPAQGGSEVSYLNAFLQARKAAMRQESSHADTSRVDTAQLLFLQAGNLSLNPPLRWKVYGDSYSIP